MINLEYNFDIVSDEVLQDLQDYICHTLGISFKFKLRRRQIEAIYWFMKGYDVSCFLPTSYGKTLIAALSAIDVYINNNGLKTIYIGLLKALTAEMKDTLADFFIQIPVQDFEKERLEELMEETDLDELTCLSILRDSIISDGDHTSTTIDDFKNGDWVVACLTPEKFDSIMNSPRKRAAVLDNVGLMIHDEIHTIGDCGRGDRMEHYILSVKKYKPELRHVYLSATVGNPKPFANWLDSQLVLATPKERPVPLEIIFKTYEKEWYNRATNYANYYANEAKISAILTDILHECEDSNSIVFVSARYKTEQIAKEIAGVKYNISVRDCVDTHGVGWHHAGMKTNDKTYVEEAYRNGQCNIIVATPTLAVGVNLPVDNCILRDATQWDALNGERLLGANRIQQTHGRAGRSTHECRYCGGTMVSNQCLECGWENKGRAYFICAEENLDELEDRAYNALVVSSELYTRLHEKILQWMKSGLVVNYEELIDLCLRSFDDRITEEECLKAINWLISFGFVKQYGEEYAITVLGKKTIDMYIQPETVVDWLLQIENVKDPNDLKELFIRFAHTKEYTDIVSIRQEDSYLQYAEREIGSAFPKTERLEYKPCLSCLKMYGCKKITSIMKKEDNCEEFENKIERMIPDKILKIYFLTFYDDLAEKYLPKKKKKIWETNKATGKKYYKWIETDEIKHINISHGDKALLTSTGSRLFNAASYIFNDYKTISTNLKVLSTLVEAGTMIEEILDLMKIEHIGVGRAKNLYKAGIKNMGDFMEADNKTLIKATGLTFKTIKKLKGNN